MFPTLEQTYGHPGLLKQIDNKWVCSFRRDSEDRRDMGLTEMAVIAI